MVQLGAWRSAVEWFRRLSWRSLRIPGLFLVSVALLTLMYRLRSDRIDKEEAEKASEINSVLLMASINVPKTGRSSTRGPMTLWPDEADLSELASHERWVVVSGVEEEEEERGGGGAPAAEVACTLAAAVKAHGWRPIVIGEGMNCCRLPDCVPLDNALLSRLPYRVLRFIKSSPLPQSSSPPTSAPTAAPQPPSRPSALRNAAFLFAIQHGARFVFDAYPPDGDPGALTSWAEEIFSSMVLGTSVGLVLDGHSYSFPTSVPGAPTPRVLNPYAHFGRPDLWAKGYDVHDADEHHQQHLRYRVCEIRQPSVEMFLDVWDGGPADLIAPPVTVPSSVLAPYGSRNVLYTRDAFWGLALFPAIGKNFSSSSSSSKLSPNLARALWNHALLGATLDAGGVRFSLVPGTQGINSNKSNSIISRLYTEEDHSIPTDLRAYVSTFTSRVLRWRCRSTTLLPCLSQLASDFLAVSLLTPEDAAFMEAWVTDLRRVRYLPPPTLPWSPRPPPRPPGPCIHPPHHHHRQLHDPPLPHPTTLTFHPIHLQRPAATIPASVRVLIARFHRDAALLEWSVGSDRTKEEVTLVEETLTEDRLLSDEESKSEGTPQSKVREENLSRKALEQPGEKEGEKEEDAEEEEATDHPLSLEVASTRTFLGDVADHLCPGFAPLASPLLPHRPSSLKLEDVLLVVWFPRQPRYDLLPALELLRTRHFPNALFCGPPHRALPSMLSRFDGRTSPSFLTATSRADCLLTALEMGYRVGDEGSLLLVEESALPIPWSLSERNRSLIWFHSEKEEEIRNKRNTRDSDGKPWEGADFGQGGRRTFLRGPEESVIMAAEGLASALRFMARLMGVRPNPHLHPHHHPMEEMEHEEAPWGRMPGNTTHHPNVTEDSSSTNETSTPFPEKMDVENTTPIVTQEITNDTGEVAAIVEEIVITEFEQTKAPVVKHIDTPSVEYSEPVVVEYTEPPVIENKNVAEIEEIKPLSEVKEDVPSIEPDDTHVEDKVETSGEGERVEFSGDKNQNSSVEGSNDDVDTSVKENVGEHIGNPEKEHLDAPDKGQEANPDGEHVDPSDKKRFDASKKEEVQVDVLEKERVDVPEKEYVDNPDKEHVKTPAEDQVDAPVEEHVETPEEERSDVPEEEKTDAPDKNHFDTPRVEHVDTPAIEYSEPHELEHFETIKIDPLNVNGTLDLHTVEQGNGSIIDRTALEIKLDANETVTILSETSVLKHDQNFTTEWPSVVNVTDIPWNDNDTKFELPRNASSSDWVTSADAEEILSSITMIENASENNTKEPDSHDEVVTEYFVNAKVNLTHPPEEANNSSLQQNFEITSPELYEDGRDEEEVVGVGEQSLLEQDTLLSYKDVEDTPQFVGLPSSTAKSHAKSLETSISVPVSYEGERRKRDTSDGRTNYSIDGFKEQFMKPRDSQEDATDESRLAVSVRLSRSLQEIEELFTELASGFPEDAEAVLREEGNPEVLSYPSPHYGLDHTDFRHLHCDYADMEDEEGNGDWGESDSLHFEPCTVLRRFFLRLYYSHKSENSLLNLLSLATTKGSAPIFHLPMRLQRELHLTASLLLSQGFPEEGVLPLLVYGLAGERGWVNLKKGSFGDTSGPFPVFDDDSDFIHPTNLRLVPEEPRLRSVFCLKFLLRVLDG